VPSGPLPPPTRPGGGGGLPVLLAFLPTVTRSPGQSARPIEVPMATARFSWVSEGPP
jgi:hypothetical protein